jgi:catechol 2,3-dioxygenase-like lactoylglutathione lyase family enzyme
MTAHSPALFGGKPFTPFVDTLPAVSEYTLIQPHARQALLQRFNYHSRLMGRFVDDALFPATQISHGGMMFTSDDPRVVDFYDRVLGLKRVSAIEMPYAKTTIQRAAFDLTPDDLYTAYIFEEPRSGADNDTRRSGRLLMFRFGSVSQLPDRRAQFSPGALGPALFTWRLRDLAEMRAACQANGCRDVGAIGSDEFGTSCFTCTTPDSFVWTFVQATKDEAATLSA